ncbi:MAG: hypothetical protein KA712_13760 [Myxococcales bacterium]|nr:hypothetical protein [Myxococcales bacterium]
MFRFGRPFLLLGFAALVPMTACVETDKAGTPTLLAFDVVGPSGSPVTRDPDAGVFSVPPRVSFNALFSELLDFDPLVDVDAGVDKPGVVLIEATGNPTATTVYTPNGDSQFTLIYAPGPSISAQPVPGLPAGSAVKVSLNTAIMRGKNGAPLVVGPSAAPVLTFVTDAFMVVGEESEMPFTADHVFKITANNLPADTFASKISVSVSVGTVPVAGVETEITPDESDPASFSIAPKSGMWPAGASVVVTVAQDATDLFGVPLGQLVTLTFPVAAP